ncbi:MAG: AbiV family abortive infection protein [Comamonas sp.]|nr:AbiV family abortive infection protein [Comamonas sp.]
MKTLSERELHELRLAIFDNAEALQKEAKLLLTHGMHSRAYLLAHFCFEELGKIPIIVGVIGQLMKGETPNWKNVGKRFYSHEEKIGSQNGHYYAFGLDADLIGDSDLEWLLSANKAVGESFKRKNLATYVDSGDSGILIPQNEITEGDAAKMVEFAFDCLRAHWRSEKLTNPILYELEDRRNAAQPSVPADVPASAASPLHPSRG